MMFMVFPCILSGKRVFRRHLAFLKTIFGDLFLWLPVGNGLKLAVFAYFPCAAFGLGYERGDSGVGLGNFGKADDAEIVGIVGVFVGFVAAEEAPAAVVFENGGFAVEEADGFALFGDGVGNNAAVERCGQCLGKFVHGVDKEMIWHDFTRFAAFPHGCVQGRFDGTMSASAVRFEHDGF